jgi:hypothetical protein
MEELHTASQAPMQHPLIEQMAKKTGATTLVENAPRRTSHDFKDSTRE